MNHWKLDRQGYVCHHMVSGPLVEPLEIEGAREHQLALEIRLRGEIASHGEVDLSAPIRAGTASRLGCPWRFHGGRDGAFVNLSEFYADMRRVRFDAAACVIAPSEMAVRAVVWSYAAADVWLNGAPAASIQSPAYKPISRAVFTARLREGRNLFYIACEALGVRDTRSIVALQFPDAGDILEVGLPDAADEPPLAEALAFLEGAALAGDRLILPAPAPEGTRMACSAGEADDFARAHDPVPWVDIGALTAAPLPEGLPWVTLEAPAVGGPLTRRFERTEQIAPRYVRPTPSREENYILILRRIAAVESLNRDGAFGFPIANLLARRALGVEGPRDGALFTDMLDLIERRVDCADFLMCGLIRYMKTWPVEAAAAARAREVMLNFRYWMDMDGFDGMCFWSENHALMFYSAAMFAGAMFPEDAFPTARMTGAALSEWGARRVAAWLEDVAEHGFEEFLSGIYMCVTFAALLNVIDYAEPGMSARASDLADRLLRQLALHTWKGGFIAPMARTYRGALYPFAQGVMSLVNLIDPAMPWHFGEGWLGFYTHSRYRVPEGLAELTEAPADVSYTAGNARILLKKTDDWCLTSVAIPREPHRRWPNRFDPGDLGPAAVKAWNERFHGTTELQPGGYGYQQHLWYAALDGAAVIFANHPGATSEAGDMRPGYWHGNGVLPALAQRGGMLGMIYRIPPEHPVHYIHLYAPECRFDRVTGRDGWLFLGRGTGYIGFWASAPMEPWQGVNPGCERRVYGDDIAALCVCGGRECGDMEAFIERCLALNPCYDPVTATLTAGDFGMSHVFGHDDTQFL